MKKGVLNKAKYRRADTSNYVDGRDEGHGGERAAMRRQGTQVHIRIPVAKAGGGF
jgi:hypothetical protein